MNEISTEKTMTVREVAKIFDVSDDTVLRATKELFPELIKNGKTTFLNETHVTAIKLKISKNYSLRNGAELPKTDLEKALIVQQALLIQQEIIGKQQVQITEMTPKAEFYDAVTGSADTVDMKEAAKILNLPGIGRNNLFEILRNKNILDRNNQPYQSFVDRGYFRIIESKFTLPTGETKISLKTVVLQKGLQFIRNQIKNIA